MDFDELISLVDRASLKTSLGGPVVIVPSSGEPVTVRGYFDRAYELLDAGRPGLSTYVPSVFLRLEDMPTDPATDFEMTVIASGVTYSIRETMPDGMGGVRLLLHKV